ncbi:MULTISPECIES: hypothetical protein [unclassified Streptomyces]|uniref:hypothetical protein n=1 Tax=unclassified Streptomyces TaxID=2593676 RepID=UPI0013A6B864|nr:MULTISPECIES: hypothetical protein [unclassified Streptomyces]
MTISMPAGSAPVGAIAGYTLVMPPGWSHIPLGEGMEDAVRTIAADTAAFAPDELPRDEVAKHRAQLEGHLLKLARKAADNSGIDLYLPTIPRDGIAIPCSIVVAQFRLELGDGVDPLEVARALAAGGDGEADAQEVDVEGGVGSRTERVRPADPAKGRHEAARTVDYTMPVPGNAARWISVSFSTPGDGDPEGEFALLLVELFDAIMTTFAWQRSGDG